MTHEELKATCAALNVPLSNSRLKTAEVARTAVAMSRESNHIYNLQYLQDKWVSSSGSSHTWSPLQEHESVRFITLSPELQDTMEFTPPRSSTRRRKPTLRMNTAPTQVMDSQSQSQMDYTLDLTPTSTTNESIMEKIEEIKQEQNYLKKIMSRFREDVQETAENVERDSGRLTKLEDLVTSASETTTTLLEPSLENETRLKDLEGKYDAMKIQNDTNAALAESLKAMRTQSIPADALRTIEQLDSLSRASNVVVMGWPLNANASEDFVADGSGAVRDATAFLDCIGALPEHRIGQFKAARRGRPQGEDELNTSQPPPLIMTMENQFKAREVCRLFIWHKRQSHNATITYNAKIDVTVRERVLMRETQEVVNLLRDRKMDARYRPGGRIAVFNGNMFSHYLERKDWPKIPPANPVRPGASSQPQTTSPTPRTGGGAPSGVDESDPSMRDAPDPPSEAQVRRPPGTSDRSRSPSSSARAAGRDAHPPKRVKAGEGSRNRRSLRGAGLDTDEDFGATIHRVAGPRVLGLRGGWGISPPSTGPLVEMEASVDVEAWMKICGRHPSIACSRLGIRGGSANLEDEGPGPISERIKGSRTEGTTFWQARLLTWHPPNPGPGDQ
ncbi:hypothetical protein DFH27DRAFT_616127 [Peziza echinospora]|nr:hypothetical protein DFH27DRAFT_616127 [Peziza echinospora]